MTIERLCRCLLLLYLLHSDPHDISSKLASIEAATRQVLKYMSISQSVQSTPSSSVAGVAGAAVGVAGAAAGVANAIDLMAELMQLVLMREQCHGDLQALSVLTMWVDHLMTTMVDMIQATVSTVTVVDALSDLSHRLSLEAGGTSRHSVVADGSGALDPDSHPTNGFAQITAPINLESSALTLTGSAPVCKAAFTKAPSQQSSRTQQMVQWKVKNTDATAEKFVHDLEKVLMTKELEYVLNTLYPRGVTGVWQRLMKKMLSLLGALQGQASMPFNDSPRYRSLWQLLVFFEHLVPAGPAQSGGKVELHRSPLASGVLTTALETDFVTLVQIIRFDATNLQYVQVLAALQRDPYLSNYSLVDKYFVFLSQMMNLMTGSDRSAIRKLIQDMSAKVSDPSISIWDVLYDSLPEDKSVRSHEVVKVIELLPFVPVCNQGEIRQAKVMLDMIKWSDLPAMLMLRVAYAYGIPARGLIDFPQIAQCVFAAMGDQFTQCDGQALILDTNTRFWLDALFNRLRAKLPESGLDQAKAKQLMADAVILLRAIQIGVATGYIDLSSTTDLEGLLTGYSILENPNVAKLYTTYPQLFMQPGIGLALNAVAKPLLDQVISALTKIYSKSNTDFTDVQGLENLKVLQLLQLLALFELHSPEELSTLIGPIITWLSSCSYAYRQRPHQAFRLSGFKATVSNLRSVLDFIQSDQLPQEVTEAIFKSLNILSPIGGWDSASIMQYVPLLSNFALCEHLGRLGAKLGDGALTWIANQYAGLSGNTTGQQHLCAYLMKYHPYRKDETLPDNIIQQAYQSVLVGEKIAAAVGGCYCLDPTQIEVAKLVQFSELNPLIQSASPASRGVLQLFWIKLVAAKEDLQSWSMALAQLISNNVDVQVLSYAANIDAMKVIEFLLKHGLLTPSTQQIFTETLQRDLQKLTSLQLILFKVLVNLSIFTHTDCFAVCTRIADRAFSDIKDNVESMLNKYISELRFNFTLGSNPEVWTQLFQCRQAIDANFKRLKARYLVYLPTGLSVNLAIALGQQDPSFFFPAYIDVTPPLRIPGSAGRRRSATTSAAVSSLQQAQDPRGKVSDVGVTRVNLERIGVLISNSHKCQLTFLMLSGEMQTCFEGFLRDCEQNLNGIECLTTALIHFFDWAQQRIKALDSMEHTHLSDRKALCLPYIRESEPEQHQDIRALSCISIASNNYAFLTISQLCGSSLEPPISVRAAEYFVCQLFGGSITPVLAQSQSVLLEIYTYWSTRPDQHTELQQLCQNQHQNTLALLDRESVGKYLGSREFRDYFQSILAVVGKSEALHVVKLLYPIMRREWLGLDDTAVRFTPGNTQQYIDDQKQYAIKRQFLALAGKVGGLGVMIEFLAVTLRANERVVIQACMEEQSFDLANLLETYSYRRRRNESAVVCALLDQSALEKLRWLGGLQSPPVLARELGALFAVSQNHQNFKRQLHFDNTDTTIHTDLNNLLDACQAKALTADEILKLCRAYLHSRGLLQVLQALLTLPLNYVKCILRASNNLHMTLNATCLVGQIAARRPATESSDSESCARVLWHIILNSATPAAARAAATDVAETSAADAAATAIDVAEFSRLSNRLNNYGIGKAAAWGLISADLGEEVLSTLEMSGAAPEQHVPLYGAIGCAVIPNSPIPKDHSANDALAARAAAVAATVAATDVAAGPSGIRQKLQGLPTCSSLQLEAIENMGGCSITVINRVLQFITVMSSEQSQLIDGYLGLEGHESLRTLVRMLYDEAGNKTHLPESVDGFDLPQYLVQSERLHRIALTLPLPSETDFDSIWSRFLGKTLDPDDNINVLRLAQAFHSDTAYSDVNFFVGFSADPSFYTRFYDALGLDLYGQFLLPSTTKFELILLRAGALRHLLEPLGTPRSVNYLETLLAPFNRGQETADIDSGQQGGGVMPSRALTSMVHSPDNILQSLPSLDDEMEQGISQSRARVVIWVHFGRQLLMG